MAAKKHARTSPKLALWKKALFSGLTVVGFFVALELALAAFGVTPILFEEDPYVGFSSYIPLYVEEKGQDGRGFRVTAANKLDWFNAQRFAASKSQGTYRIFCLGGSTTYGRPYDDTTSFSGWLRELLPVADASRKWEVINAGGISYASYRVALLMEELIRYEPDLFIIYSGHNEFLEHRTYQDIIEPPALVTGLGALLSHTRTFAVGRRLVERMQGAKEAGQAGPVEGEGLLEGEVAAVLDRSIGPRDYQRDEELRAQILAHFDFNLRRMVQIARAAGAEVILVNPAANLAGSSPFKSQHREGMVAADLARWESLVDPARAALVAGKTGREAAAAALRALDEASRIDASYAELHYLRGKALTFLERPGEAKEAYVRALEEDVCPLRALPAQQEIIAAVVAESGLPWIDFATELDKAAPGGIAGSELFLDHVHPTIEGHLLLARRLLDLLVQRDIVRPAVEWGEDAFARTRERVLGALDPRAHGVALGNLARVLNWAGKFEEAGVLALRSVKLVPGDPNAQFEAGFELARRGELDAAQEHFLKALQLDPKAARAHYNLGLVYARKQDLKRATEHLEQAVALDPEHAISRNNLGMALLEQRRLEDAAQQFAEAVRLDPGYARALTNLGTVRARQERLDEAEDLFEAALKADPSYGEARTYLERLEELRQALEKRGE